MERDLKTDPILRAKKVTLCGWEVCWACAIHAILDRLWEKNHACDLIFTPTEINLFHKPSRIPAIKQLDTLHLPTQPWKPNLPFMQI